MRGWQATRKVSLVGGGRLVTVKEDNNINTFSGGIDTLNTHTTSSKSSKDLAAKEEREAELLTKGGCHKEAAHCPRRPQAVTRTVTRRPQIKRAIRHFFRRKRK
jgi:hypothetical protein